MLFSSLRADLEAFKHLPEMDAESKRAFQAVSEAGEFQDGLGFKKSTAPRSGREVKQKLAEKGVKVSDDAAAKAAERAHTEAERAIRRQRFWVQVSISLIVLIVAFATIAFSAPAQATEKAMFGLIGTVLGYWLR